MACPQVEAMTLSCSPVYNEPEEFQWSRDDREFQHYGVFSPPLHAFRTIPTYIARMSQMVREARAIVVIV
jgi:hypothetical protein